MTLHVREKAQILRAALYARVSPRDHDQTTENQMLVLRAYVAQHDWQVVAEFEDEASAGDLRRREARRAVKENARRGVA